MGTKEKKTVKYIVTASKKGSNKGDITADKVLKAKQRKIKEKK